MHDRERAHNVLVRELGLEDEPHKADVRDPVYLEAMALVNNLCSWLKRYLWRFTGMDPDNLQSYLNVFGQVRLSEMITENFRVWARNFFGFGHGRAASFPTCPA